MELLDLARWQFGIRPFYHFLFMPITNGLSAMVAACQTAWLSTSDLASTILDDVGLARPEADDAAVLDVLRRLAGSMAGLSSRGSPHLGGRRSRAGLGRLA